MAFCSSIPFADELFRSAVFLHQFVVMLVHIFHHHIEFLAGERGHDLMDFFEAVTAMQIIEDVKDGDPRGGKLRAAALVDDLDGSDLHWVPSGAVIRR